MNNHKISVIIPFYKEKRLISRSVSSVISELEGLHDYEIFICNDGPFSKDEIFSFLSNFDRRFLNVINNKYPRGPGGARNTGLDASSGDLIAFLDADDFWLPGKIEAQLEAIRLGATFVTTSYRFDSGSVIVRPPKRIYKPEDVFLRRGIGTSTVLIDRKLLGGLRFRNIRFAQDIDYWYALAGSYHFRYASIETCSVEYCSGGSTRNKWVQLQYLYKVLCLNNVTWINRIQILISYIFVGGYNHYIKRLFS